MKIAKRGAIGVLLLIMIAPIRGAAAGSKEAIFIANDYDVTAYPAHSHGDVAPIALTTDMVAPSGIARDSSGRIYVTNSVTNTVTVYAASANGNVPPLAVIGGSNTQLSNPAGIALDGSGKIYVANGEAYPRGIALESATGGGEGVAKSRDYPGSITVYPPLGTSTGILNEAPVAAIAGSNTQLEDLVAIVVDSEGDIYVANESGGPKVRGESYDRGKVTVYSAGSKGNVAPIAAISGAATGLAYPAGVALDSEGDIYVANSFTANTSSYLEFDSSITVYPAGSNGNASPSAIIAGSNAGLDSVEGIAVDSSGNLYVTGSENAVGPSINVYPAGSNGNVSPSATIAGADTELGFSNGMVLDSSGNLYVSNAGGSVTVYPAGSSGDVVPIAAITSSFTGIDFAAGVAVDSSGKIYVANTNSSVTIYAAGSYGAGAPIATIGGGNTGLFAPFGIALDSNNNIFVLNDDNAITVYPAGSTGNVTPNATLNVDRDLKHFPQGIAVGPGGDVYVASRGFVNCNGRGCRQTIPDAVAVYPTGSNGDARTSAVISGPNTGLATPSAVAVDKTGDIYVTNKGALICSDQCGCHSAGPGTVTIYGSGSNGDARPVTTIGGANTGLGFPYGIALDSNRNIYVLNNDESIRPKYSKRNGCYTTEIREGSSDPILVFAAGSRGDVAPIDSIGGSFTGLFGPLGIGVGPGGP